MPLHDRRMHELCTTRVADATQDSCAPFISNLGKLLEIRHLSQELPPQNKFSD